MQTVDHVALAVQNARLREKEAARGFVPDELDHQIEQYEADKKFIAAMLALGIVIGAWAVGGLLF